MKKGRWYRLYFDPDLSSGGSQAYATESFGDGFEELTDIDCRKLPRLNSRISCVVLNEDTSPTDFISLSASNTCGHFIVSSRVRDLLQKFKMDGIKVFPLTMSWQGTPIDDFFLVWIFDGVFRNIDFNETRFRLEEGIISKKITELPQLDRLEILEKIREISISASKTIRVSGTYRFVPQIRDKGLDLFKVGHVANAVYVSEQLANSLSKIEPSGIELIEATDRIG